MSNAFESRRFAWLAVPAVLSLLASCSHVTGAMDGLGAAMRAVSEPPAAAPHALMRISTDGLTWVQPGSACEAMSNPRGGIAVSASQLYIGARGVTEQVRGVVGTAPKGLTSGELRLTAGEPATVLYGMSWRVGNLGYSCQVARSFVPQEGAHYQLVTSSDLGQQRCGLAVFQLSPTPALVETLPAPKCKPT